MISAIFNVSNLFALVILAIIVYVFWEPYFRGKTVEAIVDGYDRVRGNDDRDTNVYYCIRFMYRLQKAGKRYYCFSSRKFDTQKEAMESFPKGTTVKVRYSKSKEKDKQMCWILSDNKDQKQALLYTLFAAAGVTAVVVGYAIFQTQLGH